jgi:hypothetical protein
MTEARPVSECKEDGEVEGVRVTATATGADRVVADITGSRSIGTCQHSDRNGHKHPSRDRRQYSNDRHRQ